jgi:hypothetical protein
VPRPAERAGCRRLHAAGIPSAARTTTLRPSRAATGRRCTCHWSHDLQLGQAQWSGCRPALRTSTTVARLVHAAVVWSHVGLQKLLKAQLRPLLFVVALGHRVRLVVVRVKVSGGQIEVVCGEVARGGAALGNFRPRLVLLATGGALSLLACSSRAGGCHAPWPMWSVRHSSSTRSSRVPEECKCTMKRPSLAISATERPRRADNAARHATASPARSQLLPKWVSTRRHSIRAHRVSHIVANTGARRCRRDCRRRRAVADGGDDDDAWCGACAVAHGATLAFRDCKAARAAALSRALLVPLVVGFVGVQWWRLGAPDGVEQHRMCDLEARGRGDGRGTFDALEAVAPCVSARDARRRRERSTAAT